MRRDVHHREYVAVHQARPGDETLIPRERDVLTGRRAVVDREEKHDSTRSEDPARLDLGSRPPIGTAAKSRPRLARWQVVAAAGAAVVVLGGLGVAAAAGGFLSSGGGAERPAGSTGGAGGSGGSGSDVASALDPAAILGYAVTLTRQTVETGSGQEVPESEAVGTVSEGRWTCEDGLCTGRDFTFPAAGETVAVTYTAANSVLEGSPCAPITLSLDLVRADDGTYSGTMTVDPAQLEGQWEADGVLGWCNAPRTVDGVVLVPILAAGAPSASGDGADGGEVINLAGVDACSLLSVSDVQTLTSEPSEFSMDSRPGGPNEASCFWAVPKAGFPAYVELSAYRSNGSFGPLVVNNVECTATPIDPFDMGGGLAEGARCPGTVFLRAFDRGVMITLQVNEPNGSISPADLVPTVRSVFDQL